MCDDKPNCELNETDREIDDSGDEDTDTRYNNSLDIATCGSQFERYVVFIENARQQRCLVL